MIELKIEKYNSVEKMLSKFKKKVKDSKILLEMSERRHHVSKKQKNKMKKMKSKFRIKKDQEKELANNKF